MRRKEADFAEKRVYQGRQTSWGLTDSLHYKSTFRKTENFLWNTKPGLRHMSVAFSYHLLLLNPKRFTKKKKKKMYFFQNKESSQEFNKPL